VPILIFLILVVLIAQFGFWDTVQSILGAFGALVLLAVLAAGLLAAVGAWVAHRLRRHMD
jgi:hypothetical protein